MLDVQISSGARHHGQVRTLATVAKHQFTDLLDACGLGTRASEAGALIDLMMASCGDRPVGQPGRWRSEVADDHSPFELSFILGEPEPEVRLLVEAQADEATPEAMWQAGLALLDRIARRYPVVLDRFRTIEHLFRPSGSRFALWHSVVLRGSAPPTFKLYLDAQAAGRWRGAALMEDALHALGFANAWSSVALGPLARGPRLDEPQYVSLDLADGPGARVKLYVRHHNANATDIARALGESDARTASEFCTHLTGGRKVFDGRPLFTCHTFTNPTARAPTARALYVPVAGYAEHDAEIVTRLREYLAHRGLDASAYDRAITRLAAHDLASRRGMHSYVGLREERLGARVGIYLTPGLGPYDVPDVPPPAPPPRAEEIVRHFEQDRLLEDLPFLRRLGREPAHLGHLWLLLANFWEGVVQDFPKRLAHIAAKVDDDRVRCIVAKQLHDEMGEGEFSRAHKALFRKLVDAVEPYRLTGDADLLLAPGRALGRDLGRVIFSADQYEAIGALMLLEIYGKQVDVFMGRQFRRQDRVGGDSLHWLDLHENLEEAHADDSLTLARLLPDSTAAVEAAWAGAEAVADASRRYFDALHELCFA